MTPSSDSSGAARAPATFRALAGRVLAVVAIVVAINAVFGLLLDRARVRSGTRESGVINTARRLSPDILILGTSRAKHHYDDALLSKLWGVRVYNAGFQAQGFPFARVVYEQISREKAPKLVIIDVFTLWKDMENVHDLDPWYFDSPILRSLPEDGASTRPTSEDWKFVALMRVPTYRFAGHSGRIFSGAFKKGSDSGVDLLPADRPMEPFIPREAATKPNAWLIPQLEALVGEIRATGADVALCYSPCYTREYEVAILNPAKDFAAAKGIPFLDFTDAKHARFSDVRFYRDHSHMNVDGAREFSTALAAELPPLLPKDFGGK